MSYFRRVFGYGLVPFALMVSCASLGRADVLQVFTSSSEQFLFLANQSAGAQNQDSPSTLNWNESFELNYALAKFDATLGTLKSVQISFAASVLMTSDLLFQGESADVTTSFTSTLTLSDPGLVAQASDSGVVSDSFPVMPGTGVGAEYYEHGTGTFAGATVLPASERAAFTGSGTVTLPLRLQFAVQATLSRGRFEFTPVPGVTVTDVRVTYTFIPVPEPSGVMLWMVAAVAYPSLRRRRV